MPYAILGAFAARVYGSTRTTHDVDLVVALEERHIPQLAIRFPLPRYYADPEQMRNSVRQRIGFNIIDTSMGDKVDLLPLGFKPYVAAALARRIRLPFADQNGLVREAWFARPDDVIIGKLYAWDEDRSLRHEQDIGQMLLAFLLDPRGLAVHYDESYANRGIRSISASASSLWGKLKTAAKAQAGKLLSAG